MEGRRETGSSILSICRLRGLHISSTNEKQGGQWLQTKKCKMNHLIRVGGRDPDELM
jgi:hypothetical protein